MILRTALFSMFLVFVGCSGGDDAEEPVKPEAEDQAKDQAAEDKADEAEPEEEAAAEPEPEVTPEPEPTPEAAPAEPAGFDGPKVWKYVTSYALNVRSAPDKDTSTVVRHVKWGDKVEVVVNGEWAKLGTGQYISNKFLSDTDPAMKKGKGKSKAKKKGK